MRRVVVSMLIGLMTVMAGYAQTGNPRVAWQPIIPISPDAPDTDYNNSNPELYAHGDTVHLTYLTGFFRLPYFRSVDDGTSWDPIRSLIDRPSRDSARPSSFPVRGYFTASGDTLYIFFHDDTTQGGTFVRECYVKSTDRGRTWEQKVTIFPTSPIERSLWSAGSYGSRLAVTTLVNALYAGFIDKSSDGGATWSTGAQELPSTYSGDINVRLSPGYLNFFHWGGRWPGPGPEVVRHRSIDMADTWCDSIVLSPIDSIGSDMEKPYVDYTPGCGQTTFGVMWRGEGYGGNPFAEAMAVRMSYDNGTTWHPLKIVSDYPFGSFHGIAINGSTVAVTWNEEFSIFGPYQVKARVSYDGGATWEGVTNLTPDGINDGTPVVALTDSSIHLAWEHYADHSNIYYCRGILTRPQVHMTMANFTTHFDTSAAGVPVVDTILVSNDGPDTLSIGAAFSDEPSFHCQPLEGPRVAPGKTGSLFLTFTPNRIGAIDGRLILVSNNSPKEECFSVEGAGRWYHQTISLAGPHSTWRMVSSPVVSAPGNVKPYPILFGYEKRYVESDSMIAGHGYWTVANDTAASFTGIAMMDTAIISVSPGWNMIGGMSLPVVVDNIRMEPNDVTLSGFFTYSQGRYIVADTMKPGMGYWIKANKPGSVILDAKQTSGMMKRSTGIAKIIKGGELPPSPPGLVESKLSAYDKVELHPGYPNPFNPRTVIGYHLPETAMINIKVYDILGREVVQLEDATKSAGDYAIPFDASRPVELPTGVYYVRLHARNAAGEITEKTEKIIFLK
jgi:hypothetical protein